MWCSSSPVAARNATAVRRPPRRCSAAPARLPLEFLAECEDGAGAGTEDVLDALIASRCEAADLGSKADGLREMAFVAACLPVIASAFVVIRGRSGGGDPLPDAARERLRPLFGAVVDIVSVTWDSDLIDEWSIPGTGLRLDFDYWGQTFGRRIFMDDDGYRDGDVDQLGRLAHEITHTSQSEALGGVPEFAAAYCRAFWRSDFNYRGNALEDEAFRVQGLVLACLSDGTGCPGL